MQMLFIFAVFLMAMPTAQGPGDGYNLAPSPPREIKTLYWELFQTTEIWVRLTPEGENRKPAPVSLIFIATFPGKKLAHEPTDINIRAQVDLRFVASKFSLKLIPDPGELLDLAGPGANFEYYPRCPSGDCAVTGVISVVPWKVFGRMVQAKSIVGEALGLGISLREADLDALRAFAKRFVPDGAVLPQINGK
jgi:hypothetical protein